MTEIDPVNVFSSNIITDEELAEPDFSQKITITIIIFEKNSKIS